jgi:hypothetical protein
LEQARSRRLIEFASMTNSDAEDGKQVASDDHLIDHPGLGSSSLS